MGAPFCFANLKDCSVPTDTPLLPLSTIKAESAALMPSLTSPTKSKYPGVSTWHLEDGSYLRLQNLTIGYTFPKKWTKKINLEKLRVYFSGNNLKTWTNYTGYNPEVSLRNSNALSPGEDYGTYPLSKTFMIGINITTL